MAIYGCLWPFLAIYDHLAIRQGATNMGKWDISEKGFKNVAQQRLLNGYYTSRADFIPNIPYSDNFPFF